ncbi:acetamidase/formamidase family protein [Salipaludibacillus daqingensis]|uniref:acetamidase/formamidase family protein n=1 Tax=Salipaludibacillus daqingensis TaxID=3041001 RepID=UPI00247530F7|nr:acetamidase/formamidase family protein [Salipaludibacillus daqingensis]
MIHKLGLKTDHLHGSFNHDYRPILAIDSGDSLHLTTPDIQWGYAKSKGEARKFFDSKEKEEKCGHPMIGPIFVRGARAGSVLEVRLNEIVPGSYGQNWAGGVSNWENDKLDIAEDDLVSLNWELNHTTMTGSCYIGKRKFHLGLSPFMGLLGVAPLEPGVHATPPPRYCGGNIDCKELVQGSKLYLPVSVDGALFSVGDGHALQGDGEVSGTAIECPMDRVDLTLTVKEDMSLKRPRANTPSGWITFGFHEDLNEAAAMALNDMVELMIEHHHLRKTEATALASVAVDLRVTQVVNGVKGIHAVLPHGSIR